MTRANGEPAPGRVEGTDSRDSANLLHHTFIEFTMISFESKPELATFDAGAVGRAVGAAVGDDLRVVVEYNEFEYNLLYVDDDVVDHLGGPDALGALADDLHSDFRLDFTQQELYEEVYGEFGSVRAFIVVLDGARVVRFVAEDSGLYVSVDPDASLDAVLDAVDAGVAGNE